MYRTAVDIDDTRVPKRQTSIL